MKSIESITVILLSFLVFGTHAIMFKLEPNKQKCLKDELHAHQLVMGEYEVTDVPEQKIDYVVNIIKQCDI